jgi:hypothetical protein
MMMMMMMMMMMVSVEYHTFKKLIHRRSTLRDGVLMLCLVLGFATRRHVYYYDCTHHVAYGRILNNSNNNNIMYDKNESTMMLL